MADKMKNFWVVLTLCVLLVGTTSSYIGVQPVSTLGTNSFTGSASVTAWVKFDATGSMNTARYLHTATLLNDGRVLVAGGSNSDSYLANTELYDPALGTWSTTGSMNVARLGHTAMLLNNGKVLVAGGSDNNTGPSFASAELYDPVAGTWSTTGSMNNARSCHTATLLNNGKVLVAGGYALYSYNDANYFASAELYDPASGTWSATGSMNTARTYHSATLLNNGKVLVAGGQEHPIMAGTGRLASAELYDPSSGTWSTTGSLSPPRTGHTATLLNDGRVLVAGGQYLFSLASTELYDPSSGTWWGGSDMNTYHGCHIALLLNDGKVLVASGAVAELYDPALGTWSTTGNMNTARTRHTATLLNDGRVLVAGGADGTASTELGTLIPSHTLTGTLTLPSGWVNGNAISAQFVGASSAAAINAGALSNDNNTWGSWIATTSGATATTTWTVSGEGANKTVYLRLRNTNDQVATVVTGTVNVDSTAPRSSMTPLPSFVGSTNVPLSWFGSDLSGIAAYDLQARAEFDVQWTDLLTGTTITSHVFNGIEGTTYYFRVRAKDLAGNVEAWREPYDTSTVGTDYGLTINNGALFTNKTEVVLTIATKPGTNQMEIANDGGFSGAQWETYTSHKSWLITQYGSYVLPRVVYVRYKDTNGNVSATYQDDIILDVTPPTGSVSIAGATSESIARLMGNSVTLNLSATDDVSGVGGMMLSNRADFFGATWETYATTRQWTLDAGKTVYVRYKDNAGNISEVYAAGRTSAPFGFFDTPISGSTVRGSIPVTGWALDDIGVTKVEIRRDPVTGDPPGAIGADGMIYVGDATFVKGARPDVEAAWPGYPDNDRAGWGYMLLTYGLPAHGNGTFVLHAVAFDRDGHTKELGTKTIVSDNAHNTKPFGAIDTPGQGATVSGNSYVNFGWVLTPPPAMVPIDGSTIWLWIDSVRVGHPTYNQYRVDVHDAYPDYLNADGAVGFYYINTTAYTNGMHTIGWSATDDHGQEEGMGSRFFWVFNGSGMAGLGATAPLSFLAGSSMDVPTDLLSPVYLRGGFRDSGSHEVVSPDEHGLRSVAIEEVGRLVIALDSPEDLPSALGKRAVRTSGKSGRWAGYLVVGNELRPLPIGSTLDAARGVFFWQPGPGFIGTYRFVFVDGRDGKRKFVTLSVRPKSFLQRR